MTQPDAAATASTLAGIGAVFDHAAHAAPRIRDLLPVYRDLLGGRFLRGGDNHRVGYRAIQLEYGDGTKVELMEPHPGSRFLTRFLARGGGLHHVTFKVVDIELAIARMRELGFTPTAVFVDDPDWREAFLHPRDAWGALVQLAQAPAGSDALKRMPESDLEIVLAGQGPRGNGLQSP